MQLWNSGHIQFQEIVQHNPTARRKLVDCSVIVSYRQIEDIRHVTQI